MYYYFRYQHDWRCHHLSSTCPLQLDLFNSPYVTNEQPFILQLTKLSLLCIILSPALAQFSLGSIKPDVSFNEDNDRFDVSSLMSKRMFRESPNVEDGDSDEEESMRRSYHSGDNYDQLLDIFTRKNAPNMFISRKADGGFAYDDRMESEGGTVDDFEANLEKFKNIKVNRRHLDDVNNVHGFRKYRRNMKPDPIDEILMQHAVPIVLEIDGYLTPPLK